MRILVHTSHAGGIIGRGGQRIRELRDVSSGGSGSSGRANMVWHIQIGKYLLVSFISLLLS